MEFGPDRIIDVLPPGTGSADGRVRVAADGTFVRGRTAGAPAPWSAADVVPMFRSRILPAVIAIWGALLVLRLLSNGTSDGAYGGGQLMAGLLGLVMVAAGVRALLRS